MNTNETIEYEIPTEEELDVSVQGAEMRGYRAGVEQGKAEREKLIKALEQLVVWSEAFEALPPDDMKDIFPFSQYTTAGDCRQLKIALKYARAILEEKEKGE